MCDKLSSSWSLVGIRLRRLGILNRIRRRRLLISRTSPIICPLRLRTNLSKRRIRSLRILLRKETVTHGSFRRRVTNVRTRRSRFKVTLIRLLTVPSTMIFNGISNNERRVINVGEKVRVNIRFGRNFRIIFNMNLPFQVTRRVSATFKLFTRRWNRLKGCLGRYRIATKYKSGSVLAIHTWCYFRKFCNSVLFRTLRQSKAITRFIFRSLSRFYLILNTLTNFGRSSINVKRLTRGIIMRLKMRVKLKNVCLVSHQVLRCHIIFQYR